MPKIWLGPSGTVIRGHVLDAGLDGITRALHDLDARLYLRWNPKKLKKWGLWEVRRRPEEKAIKEIVEYGGTNYLVLDYVENGFENHILDVPFLNYALIEKLKQMDTWQHSWKAQNYLADMDSRQASYVERETEKAKAEREYGLRQQKSAIRDLMDYTLSGGDPSQIANHWGK